MQQKDPSLLCFTWHYKEKTRILVYFIFFLYLCPKTKKNEENNYIIPCNHHRHNDGMWQGQSVRTSDTD